MQEFIELRCNGEVLAYLPDSLKNEINIIGNKFYNVLKINLKANDERWKTILEACRKYAEYRELKEKKTKSWYQKNFQGLLDKYYKEAEEKQWKIRKWEGYSLAILRRKYTKLELLTCELLRLLPFISASLGRERDLDKKIYDESKICSLCGAGRIQKDDLIFDLSKLPKTKDIINIYGTDEIIISNHLATIFKEKKIKGALFRKIKDIKNRESHWYQLVIISNVGKSHSKTLFGDDPFHIDYQRENACKCGLTVGLNLISELFLERNNWNGSDIAITKDLIGGGKGIGYPQPIIVISKNLYQLFREYKIKGFDVEKVHLV